MAKPTKLKMHFGVIPTSYKVMLGIFFPVTVFFIFNLKFFFVFNYKLKPPDQKYKFSPTHTAIDHSRLIYSTNWSTESIN